MIFSKRIDRGEGQQFLLPLILGNMLNPLNSTMLSTALTILCRSFSKDISSGALLITPLYLASAICMPLMGRLADVFSAKKVNLIGLVLILISVIIGILAPDFIWLIVSRVMLGIGTSAAYPSSMAIIRKKYAELNKEVPPTVLGWITMASQISIVLGPLLGGIVTDLFGWQGIFYINIPLVFAAIYFIKLIPNEPNPGKFSKEAIQKLDLWGAFLFTVFLVMLLLLFMSDQFHISYLIMMLISLSVLGWWELKHPNPFIHFRMLIERPGITIIYVRSAITNLIFFAIVYALPQWLQEVKALNASKAGLIMLPLSLASATIALISSKTYSYFNLLIYGLISLTLACGGTLLLNGESVLIYIIFVALLFGASIGLNIIANQAALYSEVPKEFTGISFGLFRTIGNLGTVFSGSELKTVFRNGATDAGIHELGVFSLGCCLILMLLFIPVIRKHYNIKAT
jgi:MFS family permease